MLRILGPLCLILLATLPGFSEHDITFQPSDQTVYCRAGDTVLLSGHFSASHAFEACILEDNDTEASRRSCAETYDDNYTFSWVAGAVRPPTCRVAYTLDNGERLRTKDHFNITVLSSDPVAVSGPFRSPTI